MGHLLKEVEEAGLLDHPLVEEVELDYPWVEVVVELVLSLVVEEGVVLLHS